MAILLSDKRWPFAVYFETVCSVIPGTHPSFPFMNRWDRVEVDIFKGYTVHTRLTCSIWIVTSQSKRSWIFVGARVPPPHVPPLLAVPIRFESAVWISSALCLGQLALRCPTFPRALASLRNFVVIDLYNVKCLYARVVYFSLLGTSILAVERCQNPHVCSIINLPILRGASVNYVRSHKNRTLIFAYPHTRITKRTTRCNQKTLVLSTIKGKTWSLRFTGGGWCSHRRNTDPSTTTELI